MKKNIKKNINVVNQGIDITYPSTTYKIYNKLKKSLIGGDLTPGTKLKIDDLKKKYQTGTNPIRESLTLLIADDLVTKIDQKGFKVSEATQEKFNEILKTRIWIESIALEESMKNKKDINEWEEELIVLNHRLQKAERSLIYEPENLDSWEMVHKKFHLTLVARSKSSFMNKFCELLYDQNMRYRYLIKKKKSYIKRKVTIEHKGILDAVLKRDINKSKSLLVKHYITTSGFITLNSPSFIRK
ncbi:FCD domain-containing protein [Pelagibacteraceae bacterium]|nr:FCD domain-containing protein [Pelagibacteraceae bacterium]